MIKEHSSPLEKNAEPQNPGAHRASLILDKQPVPEILCCLLATRNIFTVCIFELLGYSTNVKCCIYDSIYMYTFSVSVSQELLLIVVRDFQWNQSVPRLWVLFDGTSDCNGFFQHDWNRHCIADP